MHVLHLRNPTRTSKESYITRHDMYVIVVYVCHCDVWNLITNEIVVLFSIQLWWHGASHNDRQSRRRSVFPQWCTRHSSSGSCHRFQLQSDLPPEPTNGQAKSTEGEIRWHMWEKYIFTIGHDHLPLTHQIRREIKYRKVIASWTTPR